MPLSVLFITGRGPITVPAQIDPPYSIGLSRERAITVAPEGPTAYVNFTAGEERRQFGSAPVATADVRVDKDDTDTRVVLCSAALGLLAVTWAGLASLRRVVRSARSGDPFDRRNATRLRVLAVCVLAVPMVVRATAEVVGHTLDVSTPVTPTARVGTWMFAAVALGLVALAEVFRVGTALREFERETV